MGQGLVVTDLKTNPFLFLQVAPDQRWAPLAITGLSPDSPPRGKGNMELPGSSQDPHRPNAHTYTHIHTPAHTDTHRDAHTDIHTQRSISLETKINELYNHIFFKISGVSKKKKDHYPYTFG